MKNTFVTGLVLALAVVVTNFLQSFIAGHSFDWAVLGIAAGIAVVGYIGKYLTGLTNTNLAMVGSAIIAVIPMLNGDAIDWKLVAATFLIKILGLVTQGFGMADQKEKVETDK